MARPAIGLIGVTGLPDGASKIELRIAATCGTSGQVERDDSDTMSTFTPSHYTSFLSPWFLPLNFDVQQGLERTPSLNVLIPTLLLSKMSGGPNTILILCTMLAATGLRVRVISTNTPIDADTAGLEAHLKRLSNVSKLPASLELVDGSDRTVALPIGRNDLFMATAWWTAQIAKYAVQHTRHKEYLYMIQDCEILLHPASSDYALALETYGHPHVPIVNTHVLLEHFVEQRIGMFSDRQFGERAIVFEPAIDRTLFYPEEHHGRDLRTLLFYARPVTGHRNLFQLGLAALRRLVEERRVATDRWEFLAMGNETGEVPLGEGATLKPLPWQSLQDYAGTMRNADVLLSLMLSPHPSYPPIEMAACGRPAVTNTFGTKTARYLSDVSPCIIGADPTIESISDKLLEVVRGYDRAEWPRDGRLPLPSTWQESFAPVLPRIVDAMDVIWSR